VCGVEWPLVDLGFAVDPDNWVGFTYIQYSANEP